MSPGACSTIVELLRWRAQTEPCLAAYTYLVDGETRTKTLTYKSLDQQARAIAAQLQTLAQPGERALLLYPPGLDFITAFFGCLYAGVVAVPAYPPRANRPEPRLRAMMADAQATLSLTTTQILTTIGHRLQQESGFQTLQWLSTDQSEMAEAEAWREPVLQADSLAFLQYTSGSTSTPRGVMISHDRLLYNLAQVQHRLQISTEDIGVSWTPLHHDMGLICGILQPLFSGTPLILLSPTAVAERPMRWLQAISHYRATMSGGPTFAYQFCLDRTTAEERANLDLSRWRIAFCGAEPVRASTLEQFATAFAPAGFRRTAFYPAYGLAEATLVVTVGEGVATPRVCTVNRHEIEHHNVVEVSASAEPGQTFVGCGSSLPGQQLAIVDPKSLTRCPPGQVGEIWVAGPSVAQGYWQQPETTQEVFQAHLADTGEGPFLRTGDLGFLTDGELFITGRLKELIILRGLNYYPQDIEETAVRSHTALQPDGGAAFSVVADGEEQLVLVHEVKRNHRNADVNEVARAIRLAVAAEQEIAVYAVVLVRLGAIPRTTSGKTQRGLCRAAFLAGRLEQIGISYLDNTQAIAPAELPAMDKPRTPTEQTLAAIWSEILGVEAVRSHDNFFALGGHSLLAMQAIARVREYLEVELPLYTVFETPTLAGLAQQIDAAPPVPQRGAIPPLRPQPQNGPPPLSYAQERMWFVHQIQPDSTAYNLPLGVRLTGPLDVSALEQSFQELVRRQASLRTTFVQIDGQPRQLVAPLARLSLPRVDLRHLPPGERKQEAHRLAQAEGRRPFDISREQLLRLLLIQLADEEHILVINMQHTIADAWSFSVMARELIQLYEAFSNGAPAYLPDPCIQYTDFAYWQRKWLQGKHLQDQLSYWRQQLADAPILELPTDHPRPAVQTHNGSYLSLDLSPALFQALREISRQEGVTLFMTLLAAFKTLLYRYTGQEDIVVGTPIANRRWKETEGLIGTFVNTLAMRTDLTGQLTFRELLGRVREVALQAYAHQDMPFEKLVAELRPERDPSYSPLVQVLFNLTNIPVPTLKFGEVKGTILEIDRGAAQFDLSLTVTDLQFYQRISLEYNTDLYESQTITRMLRHYQTLLEQIVADGLDQPIAKLQLLTADEWQQIVVDWNHTQRDYPAAQGVHQLFEQEAERNLNRVAVRAPALAGTHEEQLTYGELNRRANQLAHYLQKLGVGPDVPVGISLDRSPELVIGLLGVLKAGGAYLPLDPTFPKERLAFMLADAQASLLITQQRLVADSAEQSIRVVCLDSDWEQIAAEPTANPPSRTAPDSLAYVIYTSGSTGKPKGVAVSHHALTNFLHAMRQEPGLSQEDILLAVTTVSFDIAALELYLPLLCGAQVVLASREVAADGQRLAQKLVDSKATVMQATPATWRLLVEAGWAGDANLKIFCGGEHLTRDLADALLTRCAELWNMYGPTETTVWSTVQRVRKNEPITIGRPIANTQLYILDTQLQPVPIGVAGELYIGGEGLAHGYLYRPELTREKFLPHPFQPGSSARVYKTGDRARYLPDGSVQFLGRLDHQVKIRGFRIEPGEIETVLAQHPAVEQAVVTVRTDQPGDPRLVAYVVPQPGHTPGERTLNNFLKGKLPAYMIPSFFVIMESLPLTPNNKIDRRSLPAPERVVGDSATLAPRTWLEVELVRIWEKILGLGIGDVGIRDNFFDLGGHSLLAVRLLVEIERTFHINLPLSTLFEVATIEQLARLIEQQGRVRGWPSLVPLQAHGHKPPFFCIHGITGDILWFRELALQLAPDQPFYGIQARGLEGLEPPLDRIEAMASRYIAEIRSFQPTGPYFLGGASFGGAIALEMSRQLLAQGQEIALLAMFDHAPPNVTYGLQGTPIRQISWLLRFLRNLPFWLGTLLQSDPALLMRRLRRKLNAVWKSSGRPFRQYGYDPGQLDAADIVDYGAELPEYRQRLIEAHFRALRAYQPQIYPGKVILFQARTQSLLPGADPVAGWRRLAAGGVERHIIPGSHEGMFKSPHVEVLAAKLRECLAASSSQTSIPGQVRETRSLWATL